MYGSAVNSRHHPGGQHRRRKPFHPDPVVLNCPCCGHTVIISRRNLERLLMMAYAAYAGEAEAPHLQLNISRIPDHDWVIPATDEQIAEAVAAAIHLPDDED